MTSFHVKKVVRGIVEAQLLVNPGSFSFLGDIDLENAEIIVRTSPNRGTSIAGKILVIEDSKGSSGGALVLQTLKKIGKAPAAIVTVKAADFNLTEAAILYAVPYASHLNINDFRALENGKTACLDLERNLLILRD